MSGKKIECSIGTGCDKLSHTMLIVSLYCCHYYSNTIAPEISLHTAKIMYNWNMLLASGSLRIKVDPTSAIQVTGTDRAMNGKWVTDFSLPLKGTSVSALAADVRVRRQFTF
jgi:hypothetical protein